MISTRKFTTEIHAKDYGYDPIVWIERLLDVNAKSFFSLKEKKIIETELTKLVDILLKEK